MTVTIPADFTSFVDDEVASGRFRSTEEVLTAALSLLRERERRWDELKADIDEGIEAADAGRVFQWNADDFIARCNRRHDAEQRR